MSLNPTKAIGNIASVNNRELLNTQQKNQPTAAKTSNNNTPVSANVSLSPAASTLLSIQDHDVDMNKVEKIKQAIASGALTVDTQKIADKLIEQTAQDLEK